MKFYTTNVTEEDRHIEPKIEDIPQGAPMPPRHEEITLTITLTGSGDTRNFKSKDIVAIIAERLREIEPNDV